MPKFRSLSQFLFFVAFAICIAAPLAPGQTLASTATLLGSVSDSSGARIANANVTLGSPDKGINRVFQPMPKGISRFRFSRLGPTY